MVSDSHSICFKTYLIPNLSDYEPFWFWTYLILTCLIPTYLISNLPDSKPIWYRTHLILNPSDIESEACSAGTHLCWPSVSHCLQSQDDRQPLHAPCGQIGEQTGQPRTPLPLAGHNDNKCFFKIAKRNHRLIVACFNIFFLESIKAREKNS